MVQFHFEGLPSSLLESVGLVELTVVMDGELNAGVSVEVLVSAVDATATGKMHTKDTLFLLLWKHLLLLPYY